MFVQKSSIFCVFIFATLICLSNCYNTRLIARPHPDHPGKCYWSETSTALNIGEKYSVPNRCEVAVCLSDFSFRVSGCIPFIVEDEDCIPVEQDFDLPFPQCCSRFECPDDYGNLVRIY